MHKSPIKEPLSRTHWTFIGFYPEAPLHSMATKGSNIMQQKPYNQCTKNQPKKPRSVPSIGQPNSYQLFLHHINTSLPLAERLFYCIKNWLQMTLDPWIHRVLQEYQIKWTRIPIQLYPTITSVTSRETFQLVAAKVENLLQKQTVVVTTPCKDQFISCLFSGREKDGSYIPVINLKPLNTFVQKKHFKTESVSMTKDLLQPGDWMCFLDFKDPYLTVPITMKHREYLCFVWDGKILEFTCLSFGLYSAPWVFTKLLIQ